MILLALVFVFFVVIYVKLKKIGNHWREKGVKYVEPVPLFGNIFPLMARKESSPQFIQNLYNVFPNERYFGIFQLTTPILLVRDLDLIRQITVKNFENFVDHTDAFIVESDPLWCRSLIARTGNKWRDLRHTLSPAFTGSKLKLMFGLVENCIQQVIDYYKEKDQKVVDIEARDVCERFSNDVIASTAFGIQCNSLKYQDNDFLRSGRKLADYTGVKQFKFLLFGFFPTISKLFDLRVVDRDVGDFFTHIITEQIKIREEKNIHRPDLIHLLLQARQGQLKSDDYNKTEYNNYSSNTVDLTDIDIVAQALIFYLAGYDTTANALCAATYELAVNPDVQNRLREEIMSTLQENGGKLNYDAVIKMKYLDMVISEVLRKWPQLPWLDRVCTKPFEIPPQNPGEKLLRVEKGDAVWIPAFAIQHDPEYFPDPLKFDPERFNEENRSRIKPYAYMPFGEGPRNCIGNRYGLMSTKTFLVHLLANFEIVPNANTMIPLVASKKSFLFSVDGGCQLSLKRLS